MHKIYLEPIEKSDHAKRVRHAYSIALLAKDFDKSAKIRVHEIVGKNHLKADEVRRIGNQHFQVGNYLEALKSYNECLCHAPAGSESLALAYANRSAIYLKTRFFEFCLQNIELALNNGYPERMKQKLLQRKKECLAAKMKTSDSEKIFNPMSQIKLSYQENPKIPFMIDALKLAKNDKFGRHIITTKDLKPGDVILAEEAYRKCVDNVFVYCQCMNCSSNNYFNLKPCPKATCVMFCSDECASEAWNRYYKFECPVVDALLKLAEPKHILAYRMALNAFTMFDNVKQLKNCIASIGAETSFDVDYTKE